MKNETTRVKVRCKADKCAWVILALLIKDGNFIVKTFEPKHNCNFTFRNKKVTSIF